MATGILTQVQDGIYEIILNRPDKRNAISLELWGELDSAISQISRLSGIRAVVLRGEGKAFSAGIDVSAFAGLKESYGPDWLQKMRIITADMQAVVGRLERLEIPTIALLHGFCLGMGLELALACDFRLGSVDVKLGLPEVLLGIIPDVGGTTRLTRIVGPARAKEIIMTGRHIDAPFSERIGLLNKVVPTEQLAESGHELARELTRAAPLAVGMAKRVIDGMDDGERGLALEAWAQSLLFQTEDFAEGVAAMMQKRAPHFKGK
jgi:enoyl-CoA hydratase/carnithine racemase